MALFRQLVIWAPLVIIYVLMLAGRRVSRNRQRAGIAPSLHGEIGAQECFTTPLNEVSIFGPGRFAGNLRRWVPLPAPRRLVVGTNAFAVSDTQRRARRRRSRACLPRMRMLDLIQLRADPGSEIGTA